MVRCLPARHEVVSLIPSTNVFPKPLSLLRKLEVVADETTRMGICPERDVHEWFQALTFHLFIAVSL